MNKIHTLSWGVIAVIMAMQQVQAESTFDYANYPRPDLYSKKSWLFRDETGRIFDGAGHLLPRGGEQSKRAGKVKNALFLLAPASVFAMGPGDEEARRQEAFAFSGNAAGSAEADRLTLMGLDSNIKKKFRLKYIVIDEQSKLVLNQPLITDITNTADIRAENSEKYPLRTVNVLNDTLYLMGEANLNATKTIIHETGFLGGLGVISGNVKNKGRSAFCWL